MSSSHRPGSLRQENKKHKSNGHQSKRASKSALGAGRVALERGGVKTQAKKAAEARKQNRVNHGTQMRKKKREEIWLQKRLGSDSGPPKLCAWVSLSATADTHVIQQGMLKGCATSGEPSSGVGMLSASFTQFKQRITFLSPDRDLTSVLEFAKVADVLLVVLPVGQGPESAIDEARDKGIVSSEMQLEFVFKVFSQWLPRAAMLRLNRRLSEGEMMITALKAAGLPSVVGVVQGLELLKGKKQSDMRKWGQRFFETEFAGQAKAIDASNPSLLARTLGSTTARRVHWRSIRSYLLADTAQVVPVEGPKGAEFGTLHVRGYIRGRPMGVNQVVHLGDVGHFRLRQIKTAAEPFAVKSNHRSGVGTGQAMTTDVIGKVLATADRDKQEDLNVEAATDGLAGEQTWPTEEELAQAGQYNDRDGGGVNEMDEETCETHPREEKSLPQGWSGYQAEWMTEAGSADGEDMESSDEGGAWALEEEGRDKDSLSDHADADLHASKRRNAEDEDVRFPDEVNTPADRSARERFARFRALKSFRTSPWDPKESLPKDYARIFQFEDFPALQKEVLSSGEAIEREQNRCLIDGKAESHQRGSRKSSFASCAADSIGGDSMDDGGTDGVAADAIRISSTDHEHEGYVSSGQYVEVIVDDVPLDLMDQRRAMTGGKDWPLVLFSLLRHEHRLSTLHFNISRDARYTEPIPSKEPLIFQCGFRRWTGRPVFSQVNLNCDKHKYERYLQPDRFTAASVYGPTTFQPGPVLVFKNVGSKSGASRTVLVATGTLLGVDPDRMVLKKIVLTGYPIRVRKRKAVVKHMFHRPEDVKWFKPAELVTKYGLTGHIKEPVGTHGLMKVIFNKAVKQNDTVCLNLYKRVYPKMVNGEVVVR